MSLNPLNMPNLDEFGEFRTASGRLWNLSATPLSPGGESTNDQGCVAVAHHPDGSVILADTKLDLVDQAPMFFLRAEWSDFKDAIRENRV